MNITDAKRRAGGAGLIAAMIMVSVQLAWRVLDSKNNVVQAFPEFIATAIARLTPLSIFGTVTETYGSLAKRSLLTACVLGIVVVGPLAGRRALALAGGQNPNFARRFIGGLSVAVVLLGLTLLVILPVANLGIAARDSSYTSDIITQLVVTFALWALVWAALSAEPQTVMTATGGEKITRRAALQSGSWAVLGLGAIGVGIASLVDMFRVPKLSAAQIAAQEQAVQEIVATQVAEVPATPGAAGSPVAQMIQFDLLETEGKLTPRLTATRDFYHVSKNFTDPTVSADGWTLKIDGSVTTPKSYGYEDLVALATTKNITTLCCISNELNGSLISTAEWTGIPLIDLLNEAGVSPTAVDLKFTAADDYTDSIPVSVAMDRNVLLVIGMNGLPLQDDHGFPARLIIPPIYGMKNVKWLQKIEAVDSDYLGYWQERGWSDTARYQIWGRIDYPTGSAIAPGPAVVCGMASAGNRGVRRVEISLDDAETWNDAELEESLNAPFTWVRWAYPFEAATGNYKTKIRVTDGEGSVMLESEQSPLPDGATGWPSRTINVS